MKIQEIMTGQRELQACQLTDSAQKAAQLMKKEDIGIVPVVSTANQLVGVVTDRDLCMEVVAEGRNPDGVRIEQCMHKPVFACHPDDDVQNAIQLMKEHQVRRIPIVDQKGTLCGIISMADFALENQIDNSATGEAIKKISQPT